MKSKVFNRSIGIFLSIFTALNIGLSQDHGCDNTRYYNPIFEEVEVSTIAFGKNIDPQGDSVTLMMDVYYPAVDEINDRPLIVWAHGGAFISGDRDEMKDNCIAFAKKGYVTATIDYRLFDFFANGLPNEYESTDIAIKAMGDMKAAIRWFKADAMLGDNQFGIDTSIVFAGGYSAGAITALLSSIYSSQDKLSDFIQEIVDENGGIKGNTGDTQNLIFDASVKSVISLSGAVLDTSWIQKDDPIILSYHGTEDETLNFNYGPAKVFNIELIDLYGSGKIYEHTSNQGWPGLLYPVEGGGHVDIYVDPKYEDDLSQFISQVDTVLTEIICGSYVSTNHVQDISPLLYPNPTGDYLQVDIKGEFDLRIFDLNGQMVLEKTVRNNNKVDVSGLIPGSYIVEVHATQHRGLSKLIIQR